jgi:hypothetical protein
MAGQQLDHHAFVARIQMLDQHECHAGIGGKRIKELLARIEPARGGPDPNDGKISRDWREFGPR